ncbi:MAG: AAA family ATPase [Candidimonas sp.]
MMTFKPSIQQQEAIDAIVEWYRHGSDQIFYLAGYAGTGKTTMIETAVKACGLRYDSFQDTLYGAYMGKAALALKKRGLNGAQTVHRLIYNPVVDKQTKKVSFVIDKESQLKYAKLLVLDECSMIDESMAMDLLSFGTKILVIGDPGQIRPINGEGYFTKRNPNYFLTEIHRQAENNPIIRLATMVRMGERVPFGQYGNSIKIPASEVTMEQMVDSDQVITGKNVTRMRINNTFRHIHGFNEETYPSKSGAKLVCLRNNYMAGILNGMLFYTIDDEFKLDEKKRLFSTKLISDDDDIYELDIANYHFDYYEKTPSEKQKRDDSWKFQRYCQFEWGWCLTVHKSQGSQWPSIVLYDDGFGIWDRQIRSEWLYTAITRAENTLIWAVS